MIALDPDNPVALDANVLGRLMPLHVCLWPDGTIRSAGPTLHKIMGARAVANVPFFDLFEVRRPTAVGDVAQLRRHSGARLRLSLRGVPGSTFRGHVLSLPSQGGLIVNLSFGIDLANSVQHYLLSDADFAPTDLAIELLYLSEAKTAVMGELRDLNLRLQSAKSEAELQALTDTLTGLSNRRAMDIALSAILSQRLPFSLMQVDLDHFKQVNDTHGHAAGDHVLCQSATILRDQTRSGDLVARVGGDEFVVVFPGLVDPKMLHLIADRIIGLISGLSFSGDKELGVSASIGIALSTSYSVPDRDRILSDADCALYRSKHAGRARASLYTG